MAARWLYEDGIADERAILIENGRIIEAHIERHGTIKAGLIAEARLTKILVAGKRAIAALADGSEILLSPTPKGLTEGAALMVEIRRAAINEQTRFKLPLGRPARDDIAVTVPSLYERIEAGNIPVRQCYAHEADHFAESGWHELTEEARSGIIDFDGGNLILSVTPAMTLLDVDGDLPPHKLSLAAASASAAAIRRLDLQGSIGIDFPGLSSKTERQSVAEAFDDAMSAGDYERTAMNGFGFMQIVKRRTGPSLPEILQHDMMHGLAAELLRRAERDRGSGGMRIAAHPAIIKMLEKHADWLEQLANRTGRPVSLRADPKLSIGGGYAE